MRQTFCGRSVRGISVFSVALVFVFVFAGLAFTQAEIMAKRKLLHRVPASNNVLTSLTHSRAQRWRQAPPPNTSDSWTGGGDGTSWSDASNWSAGVPNSGTIDVTIGTTTANVNLNQVATIGNLTLSHSGDTLTVQNGQQLIFDGSSISNAGTITLASSGSGTVLSLGGSLTLSGGGTVVLGSGSSNRIDGVSGATLTNASTITGGNASANDYVGFGHLALDNTGTINANVSGGAIIVDPGAASTNTGMLEASNGGALNLAFSSWTNTGGTIEAQAGSTVLLNNGVTVTGGKLTTSGTGIILGDGATLVGVTNAGNFQIQDGQTTNISGTITNTGTINLSSTGNVTTLFLSGNATLTGTGTVVLGGRGSNRIDGVPGATLTNASTITGGNASPIDYVGFGHLCVPIIQFASKKDNGGQRSAAISRVWGSRHPPSHRSVEVV
jgi:hypothetical protein